MQRQQVIRTYHEGNITSGSVTKQAMQDYLSEADIVLLLVSADLMASDQQYHYAQQALNMGKQVVPVIVRPCMWQNAAWANLTALPNNGNTAISQYPNTDEGFYEIAIALRLMIDPTYQKPDYDRYREMVNSIGSSNEGTTINNAKNTVANSNVTAGRDVNIGDTNIHYHLSGKTILRALNKNPPKPTNFIGRETELAAIHQKLFGENNLLLLVNGEGGVGKTTLAAQYYHQYQHLYAHTAWVLAERSLPDTLLDALTNRLDLEFADSLPTEERFGQLLTAMANLQKPCLLVIDNANNWNDLHKHHHNLRRCPNFHILLTTRIADLNYAAYYRIEGLPYNKALELFTKYYPLHNPQDNELFRAIHTAVGQNTLVIELLAKNLHQVNKLNTQYTLPDLLKDLQNKGVLGFSQSKSVSTDYRLQQVKPDDIIPVKPEVIIEAMYDLTQLPDDEKHALTQLALLPPEALPFGKLQELIPQSNLEETLLNLATKGWINYIPKSEDTEASFRVSPVVQAVCLRKNPQQLHMLQGMISTLIERLGNDGKHLTGSSYQDAALYALYAENLVQTLLRTEHTKLINPIHEQTAILCGQIGTYHTITGNLPKALGYFEEDHKLSKELHAAYPDNVDFKNGLAISYSKLGETFTSLGNLEKALGYFEERHRLSKELYDSYPNNVGFKKGLAISYEKLGKTFTSLGNLEKALGNFEERHNLNKELHDSSPDNVDFKNGLAISYSKLGETFTSLGNLEKALVYF